MTGAALLAVLALAAQGEAPRELAIGRADRGGWQLAAVTIVGDRDGRPAVDDMRCTIRRRGFELILPLRRPVAFRLGGAGTGFAEADIAAVALDRRAYAARIISDPRLSRYRDVDYPPAAAQQAPIPEPATTLAVQGAPDEPFLHVASLLNEMLAARRLTIRYRRPGGEGRFVIPMSGFARALAWCHAAFASDRARRLHRR